MQTATPPCSTYDCKFVGFTLIELSIVLVIIGLIVGGILVGQDLINAAAIRAQISQIEKYNTAVNTFKAKYGYLPGDIPDPYATQAGFSPRGTLEGEGDGNDVIEGKPYNNDPRMAISQYAGETAMFWSDLTYANGGNLNLIPGSFTAASETVAPGIISGSALDTFFPAAKMGGGNYVFVYSSAGTNYYSVSIPSNIQTGQTLTLPGTSVIQAYNIDVKIDDGLPQSGNDTTVQLYAGWTWAPYQTTTQWTMSPPIAPYTTPTVGSAATCFDNSATSNGTPGVNGAVQHYSTEMNGGSGVNCALSFRFQ